MTTTQTDTTPLDLARSAFLALPGISAATADEARPHRAADACDPSSDDRPAPSRVVHLGVSADGEVSVSGIEGRIGPAACSIGAFDGVHQGHRFLFAHVVDDARAQGIASAIVTFDPDPDELFLPRERVRKLLSNEDRIAYLRTFGADYVVVVSFTHELAAHSCEGFLHDVLGRVMDVRAIHVGDNFRLGAGNAGTVEHLRALGERDGFSVFGHVLRRVDNRPVSATRVRDALAAGDVDEASDLLCRPYYLRGTVVDGRHEGHGLGFPTANVRIDYPYVMPAEGVYGGFLEAGGVAWPAAINVGIPRTFADREGCAELEANLLGFSGNLYGESVRVAFTKFLRPQRKFDDIDELIATVKGNIAWVGEHYGEAGLTL